MFHTARKGLMAIAALGALALGGSALASAASKSSSSSSTSNGASSQQTASGYGQPPPNGQRPPRGGPGQPHVGANGQQEKALTGDVADKVKAAALAKVSGGTLERVETDVDHGSPYEAHIRTSDGSQVEVLVDKDFQVTAVNTMQHP
ncbi:MAG: hypothetical protein QOC78_2886 [Solirubrobacteraceae bacterium]|jgi:hypothetical protein|nr:hypothetical protein [Solirubrobacteraceae bacterium]